MRTRHEQHLGDVQYIKIWQRERDCLGRTICKVLLAASPLRTGRWRVLSVWGRLETVLASPNQKRRWKKTSTAGGLELRWRAVGIIKGAGWKGGVMRLECPHWSSARKFVSGPMSWERKRWVRNPGQERGLWCWHLLLAHTLQWFAHHRPTGVITRCSQASTAHACARHGCTCVYTRRDVTPNTCGTK